MASQTIARNQGKGASKIALSKGEWGGEAKTAWGNDTDVYRQFTTEDMQMARNHLIKIT